METIVSELKQFKCLTDMKKFLSELGDYKARPVIRGKHATLYEDRANGKYRTVMASVSATISFPLMKSPFYLIDKWVSHFLQHGAILKSHMECIQIKPEKNL